MPDDQMLTRMYGLQYATLPVGDGEEDPKDTTHVMGWLRGTQPGVFLDFGCGKGELLRAAQNLGWRPIGLELDPAVARAVSTRLALPVLVASDHDVRSQHAQADVIHIGDVVEHLTRPLETVRSVLSLVKPGGLVLAQGPLEGGPCLYTSALRIWQRVVRPDPIEMPPYHVLQATVAGQRAFFARLGLEEVEYKISEVSWPAPPRLTRQMVRRPRAMALWALRRASMLASKSRPGTRGNRYFYAGRRGVAWPAMPATA
jgi:SAM-dependent methyltransferase